MNDERDYSEYGFDPNIVEHEGFSVGDEVVMAEDDEERGYFIGEEGQVVELTLIPAASDPAMAIAFGNDPNEHIAIYVLMEGTEEPIEVKAEMMEVA